MNELFYITSRLAKVSCTRGERARIGAFFDRLKNDNALQAVYFEYCRKWKLAPWLHTRMQREGFTEFLNAETKQLFNDIHAKTLTANENRNAEATRFLRKFHERGIDVAVLKGNLFAHTFYHDRGYKRMNDFDILIRPEDWGRVQDVYGELEYIPMGFGWSGEKQKAAKFSHTGIPFISRNFHCIIGTQWGIKSPTTHYTVNLEEAWKTASDYDFFGVPVKQLSPEYNLLHLVLHMGIYKCGTRDCMDVYNLMQAQPMNEDKLVDLFERSNCKDKALFTLKMSAQCSDIPEESLLGKLSDASGFVARRLKNRNKAIAESGDIHTSYNDYFQDVEKNVLYFNIVHKFHQKTFFYGKIIAQIWWPPMEFALKFIDKAHRPSFLNKLQARLRAPGFVFAILAQEIGWTITFILYMKLFFDLLFSLVNYFIPKENYFDYLKRLGIDPKHIKKVVSDVQ